MLIVSLRRGSALCALAAVLAAPAAAQMFLDPRGVLDGLAAEKAGPTVRSMQQSGSFDVNGSQALSLLDLPTVDVQVGFEADTALLSVQGMVSLRSVAMALKAPEMEGQRFQVAGHYVSASDQNQAASQPISARRAQAVVRHLTSFYGIAPDRLVPFGYGATDLADQMNPASPANTRIELINITAQ
ncbi:MAG: OmpA family protein [Pseudomonadota bacterium]